MDIIFFSILIMAVICGLIIWFRYLHTCKKAKTANIIKRIAVAIIIAIPFLILDFAILITSFWDGHPPPRRPYHRDLVVQNQSSLPLWINASFAYTYQELSALKMRGIYIDPKVNFTVYQNIRLDNPTDTMNTYGTYYFSFSFLLPTYADSIDWPAESYITLSDSMGKELLHLDANQMEGIMRNRMYWDITDSLLNMETIGSTHTIIKSKGDMK